MNLEKHTKTVNLLCPTCGSSTFDYDESNENGPVTCDNCKRKFTREELMQENGALIEENIDEVKEEALAEIKNNLEKQLKMH